MKRKDAQNLPCRVSVTAEGGKVLDIRSQLSSRRILTANADYVHCEQTCSVSALFGITTDGIISLVRKRPTKQACLILFPPHS